MKADIGWGPDGNLRIDYLGPVDPDAVEQSAEATGV
jgi:hypothetical protein